MRHIIKVAPVEAPQYITQLLGEFEHVGPNGTHKCLVFEPMGPSANTMVEELPQFKPRRQGMKIRYPPQMARSILKQSLQALAFLHGNGIAHGDFQPGNILFALRDIDSQPEDVLLQEEDVQARSISPPVQRLDGKQDRWAPRYLCAAQPLAPFTPYAKDFKVKLSDIGGGQFPPFPWSLVMDVLYTHACLRLNSIFLYRPADKTRHSTRPSGPRADPLGDRRQDPRCLELWLPGLRARHGTAPLLHTRAGF